MDEPVTGFGPAPAAYSFGRFVLEVDTQTLTADGETIRLRPQSFDVLHYLLAHNDRLVTRDELQDSIWGDTIVTDNSLRQCLIEIRKAIGDTDRRIIRTVPRRGLRVDIPVTAHFAAASGSGNATMADDSPPLRMRPRGAQVVVAAALVILSIAAVMSLLPRNAPPTATAQGVFRLQPLVAGAGVKDADSIAAMAGSSFSVAFDRYGLATVIAPYGLSDGRLPELDIHTTLIRDGSRPSIDVRLSEAQSGTSIWTRRYESNDGDLGGLLEQSATQTAYAMECGLFRRGLIRREIPADLFGAWIRACVHAVNQERVEFYEQMLEIVEMAPADAASHAALANGIMRMLSLHREVSERDDLIAQADSATRRALELEPEFPEALLLQADILPYGKWAEKEALILRAFASDPHYKWNRSQYLMFLHRVGRLDEARHFAARTTSLMRGPNHLSNEAWLFALTGDVAEAGRILDATADAWPQDKLGPRKRLFMHAYFADASTAEQLLGDPFIAQTFEPAQLACWQLLIDYRLGRKTYERDTVKTSCPVLPNYQLPRVMAAMGDVDGAFAELNVLYDQWGQYGHENLTMILFGPEMDAVRRDPRFMSLAERSGLASYWAITGERPDFCDTGDLDYDCDQAIRLASREASPLIDISTSAMN